MRLKRSMKNSPAALAARQNLYHFAALTQQDPRTSAWARLRRMLHDPVTSAAAALIRDRLTRTPACLERLQLCPAQLDPFAVLMRLPASRDEMIAAHDESVGAIVGRGYPPFAEEYLGVQESLRASWRMANLAEFCHAAGVRRAATSSLWRDHVVLELEFMALLQGLRRRTLRGRTHIDLQQVRVCRRVERQFFRDHVSSGLIEYALAVERESSSLFYKAAARFLIALAASERAWLSLPPLPYSLPRMDLGLPHSAYENQPVGTTAAEFDPLN